MVNNKLKLSDKLRHQVDKELEVGESIRWIEQPIPRFFTATSIGSFLFGIPFTSFAIFWMYGASGFKVPDLREGIQPQHLFALFGIPFVLTGLGMLSSPIWVWLASQQTVYLITNKRAISIEGGFSTTIKSYSPEQLKDIYRKERGNGTGDVVMGVRRWKDSNGREKTQEIGFMGIRNPQEVEKILKQLGQDSES